MYRLPPSALINLSHGQRKGQAGSTHKPTAVVKPQYGAASSSSPRQASSHAGSSRQSSSHGRAPEPRPEPAAAAAAAAGEARFYMPPQNRLKQPPPPGQGVHILQPRSQQPHSQQLNAQQLFKAQLIAQQPPVLFNQQSPHVRPLMSLVSLILCVLCPITFCRIVACDCSYCRLIDSRLLTGITPPSCRRNSQ